MSDLVLLAALKEARTELIRLAARAHREKWAFTDNRPAFGALHGLGDAAWRAEQQVSESIRQYHAKNATIHRSNATC